MRQALAPADQEAGEPSHACAACTKNEFAIDGLTHALAGLRRGAEALRDENAELRAELSHLRQRQSGSRR